MKFIKVKNKNNTSGKTPPSPYSSWLDFWEKKKGKKATKCEAMSCNGKPDVGGHVIKSGESSKEYILPLCYSHNNKSSEEEFSAWETDLIPVS
ncbi:hypothetical protein EHQ68_11180 [Leptospira congkakensis]|uniref:Uncharacterized protein n=1 Tax=Leptospira congkakensis TaxID=2484932 RepID=A0A4Z1A5L7_9LEPT|nr:hypothetical protein [Leptospira congkakensis]TGL87993.1 hypothetical protein EHQ68_11180 [Leptospira congkakensis]TGL88393.1 hypothetical protein EHQ69_15345 [Leptospira congkakensis]TGL93450.1 hypothetical protein EHQ70_17430 [Leptospira congkakensis]